jgi:ABC-type nitrate/sulfonate/bicarbonate transport system permease component
MAELDVRIAARPGEPRLRLDAVAAALARRAGAIGSLVVLVVAWEAAARSGIVTAFLLPPLSTVLARVGEDVTSGELAVNLGATMYRALIGFAIAGAGGIVLGILMARRP